LRDASGVAHEKQSDKDLELDPDEKVVSILDLPEVQKANAELERRVDEAHARLARVQLLFWRPFARSRGGGRLHPCAA
jgi:hypothetical protein